MWYLAIWVAAIVAGILFFHEYFWINIVIMVFLHFLNHKYCGEMTKYAMTTILPMATAQIIGIIIGREKINLIYSAWLVPILIQTGIPIPQELKEQMPFIMAILLLITMEAFFMRWVNVPIQRNHSHFMRNILRSNSYGIFSNQIYRMLYSLDEDTQWNDKNFIRLNAEVDVLCNNKARPKTKDLLCALQQSPRKNNITLVIGEPGSGKSVAMRKLCAELMKTCKRTCRIPLYINLKYWNKNWEKGLYPTPKDLERFILDSVEQYDLAHFLKTNFEKIMENRGWFFILDSYDEIPFLAGKNQTYNSQVSKVIYDFLSNNGGVLASRPFRSPEVNPTQVRNHFRILPFDERHLIQFFRRDVGLSKSDCQDFFKNYPHIVDIARTPLLGSLVWQYYRENRAWPTNQKTLYRELMVARIRKVLEESGEKSNITVDLIMEMTATLAYKMIENESSRNFLTLEESYEILKDPPYQIDTVVGILEATKICKLNGTHKEMITFVHRRFMEFFVTQCSQFNQQTMYNHLSDICKLGSYYDVLSLYGEICEPDVADSLLKVCSQAIMNPSNDFQNIRNENCLHAINSLNFLFNAFCRRANLIETYITPISKKILQALNENCHDNACLAVFATVIPILDWRYQEGILLALLDFKYRWISQYLSRIFYRCGMNSEKLLLAYIENLNTYKDLAFLRDFPVLLFVFAKEKSLKQYCFLRVVDIMLSIAASVMLGGYAIWNFLADPALCDCVGLITWFQDLSAADQIYNIIFIIFFLGAFGWIANYLSFLRATLFFTCIVSTSIIFATAKTDFIVLIWVALYIIIILFFLFGLNGIVNLKLEYRRSKRKYRFIGVLLLGTGGCWICMMLFFVGIDWVTENYDIPAAVFILLFSFCAFVVINPIRLMLDAIHLWIAIRELKKCRGILPRPQLEEMLNGIRGKRCRARLANRLSGMNIQLNGDWANGKRPLIGMEREDQLLTSLDTKDLPLAH